MTVSQPQGAGASESPIKMTSEPESPEVAGLGHNCSLASSCGFFFFCGLDGKAFSCTLGDQGSIPALGRSPGEGNGNLLWKIPWTEKPHSLQSMGSQRVGHD